MYINNILSVFDNFSLESVDDVVMKMASDFRARRVEKISKGETISFYDKSSISILHIGIAQ